MTGHFFNSEVFDLTFRCEQEKSNPLRLENWGGLMPPGHRNLVHTPASRAIAGIAFEHD